MRPPVTYMLSFERTSQLFGKAFAEGCGGKLVSSTTLQPGDIALFGSPYLWDTLQQAKREGRTWYYGDHGFFVRGQQYRITRNSYQHPGRGDTSQARWLALGIRVQPWRKTGRDILLCPQTERYHRLFGMNREQWLSDVTRTLRQYSDRPIIVRDKQDPTPIEQALQHAWAVVSYSSAVAIDAMIAGVPNFTLAPFASAYSMGSPRLEEIERPFYPDNREPFLAVLANNQWSLEEMRRGVAWRALQR